MTVWAVHETKDSISPARKFGDIVYINQFYIHGDELERNDDHNLIPTGYRVNMERAINAFAPRCDYLLISGDHLQLLAMTGLLAGRFEWFDVLRWDRQLREYIPVRLHSGLVPPRGSVLVSGTHIGDTDAEEFRRNAQAVAIESPPCSKRTPGPYIPIKRTP